MLKAAWHWGRDHSVINDLLGELSHTPLYVGLASTRGSVDGDHTFSPRISLEDSLTGDSWQIWMNGWTIGGSMDRDHMFFAPDFVGGLLDWGLWHMNEWIKHWLLEMEQQSPWGPIRGTWSGGSLTRDFKGKANYQGMGRRRFHRQVSVSIGAPWGNLGGGGSIFWELWKIVEGGLLNWSISLCRSSVRGTWRRAPVLGIQKDM
jgi:hypothetical protein